MFEGLTNTNQTRALYCSVRSGAEPSSTSVLFVCWVSYPWPSPRSIARSVFRFRIKIFSLAQEKVFRVSIRNVITTLTCSLKVFFLKRALTEFEVPTLNEEEDCAVGEFGSSSCPWQASKPRCWTLCIGIVCGFELLE